MKILWNGPLFNPTGIATAAREMVKALVKKGVEVQCTDVWNSDYEFNAGLEGLNKAIDGSKVDATIFYDYPQNWKQGRGITIGHFCHEGTKLHQGWSDVMNRADIVTTPSLANRNMFRWNGVKDPIVINYGVSPIFKPKEKEEPSEEYVFLSVNSWTGQLGDRKGTDLLIKAFDEEFKEENIKLVLKISTFWRLQKPEFYAQSIVNILGHANKNILFNPDYFTEEQLAEYYRNADCFVSPTRGEGFGLTILNALATGLPTIVTKDINSGHMDFCKDNPAVIWVDAPSSIQGDPQFYAPGNLLAEPSLEDLKKKMRYAYENRESLKKVALDKGVKKAKEFTWDKSANKLISLIKQNERPATPNLEVQSNQ